VKYFDIKEFDCSETGENQMDEQFLEMLDVLRENCGFPFVITSGYRSIEHSIEQRKAKGGTHTQGIASDIKINDSKKRMIIVTEALRLGFTGIGIADTFIHVDIRETTPVMWTYA
tara:strand:+ start:292 stop:636 length:345 start_codon:yes stop_codon:yes gene_type:complete